MGALLLLTLAAAPHAERSRTYVNPVLVETYEIRRSNPSPYVGTLGIGDPGVVFHDGTYYLYPTGDNYSYSVYRSADLVRWTKGPKVFESSETGVWAPDVYFDRSDGRFYLYYTVSGRIGVAVADRPDSRFTDRGMLISDAIDAHLFRDDDGSLYLYYARYPDFAIFVQPMASPAAKSGDPIQLLVPTETWEQTNVPVIEAPWMIRQNGVYYLLYSGGSADSEHYAMGYATAHHPLGPFTKHAANPIVRSGSRVLGPGHASVVRDESGKFWMIYHQQKTGTRGWNRIICIDPVWIDADGVLHATATRAVVMQR